MKKTLCLCLCLLLCLGAVIGVAAAEGEGLVLKDQDGNVLEDGAVLSGQIGRAHV